ncbi:MAG: hypothetical protein COA58_07170 [Bacteroidetes bacterium]|nr:MAG: hypothetical protein COA58_07170 [Bacteroidota bacterium]
MVSRYILILFVWYLTTSFQVGNDRSLNFSSNQDNTQSVTSENQTIYSVHTVNLLAEDIYHIILGQNYTAIKITPLDTVKASIRFSSDFDSLNFGAVQTDENIDIPTSFAIFSQPTKNIKLISDKSLAVRIELFYASVLPLRSPQKKNKKSNCEKPITISQTEWRQGLPEPITGRNATVVKHCVIHHSAGNNGDTNYLNTVRNIYLLHTQSNGWDDIGYNFLIAPNGTIFSGRDAQNVADEDNIQGAHFCGKNGGTMGVCLLGNYNNVSPSLDMTSSLVSLLSWKLHKEDLETTDEFPHPNSLSDHLPTITMHRTGCSTQCPGDSTALLIDTIRQKVQTEIDNCKGITKVILPSTVYKQLIYPNPSDGRFYVMIEAAAHISTYRIVNLNGKELFTGFFPFNGRINTDLQNGQYILELYSELTRVSSKKIQIIRP